MKLFLDHFSSMEHVHTCPVCVCVHVHVNLQSGHDRRWFGHSCLAIAIVCPDFYEGNGLCDVSVHFAQFCSTYKKCSYFFFLFPSFFLRSLASIKQNKIQKHLVEYYANVSYLIMVLWLFIIIRAISHYSLLLASTSGTYLDDGQVWYQGDAP